MDSSQHNGVLNNECNNNSLCLLIVASQTFSADQVNVCLNQISSSLNQLDSCLIEQHKDELVNFIKNGFMFDESSINFDQEYRFAYESENGNFLIELQINSKLQKFKQSLKQFLLSTTHKNKYLICSSFDFNSMGDIHLQDGLFTYDDLHMQMMDEECKKSMTSINKFGVHLSSRLIENNRNWKLLEAKSTNHASNISVVSLPSRSSVSTNNQEIIDNFVSKIKKFLNEKPSSDLINGSKFTGTLKISKPVLYIFPACEGDSAFFTINGFSLLINGGYDRVKPCFWKFVNMLQQINSVLITHSDSDALGGLSTLFSKKLADFDIKPSISSVLGNLIHDAKNSHSANVAASAIAGEIASNSNNLEQQSDVEVILDAINKLGIKFTPLVNKTTSVESSSTVSKSLHSNNKYEHINLYYCHNQGSLDLYVLSPFINSNEYKEFVNKAKHAVNTNTKQHKSLLEVNQLVRHMPLAHLNTAIVLLVWLPEPEYIYHHNSQQNQQRKDNHALRLLFTGNAPQHVILNALDKVKDFDILSTPVYKVKPVEVNLAGSVSTNSVVSAKKPPSQSLNESSNINSKKEINDTNSSTAPTQVKSSRTSLQYPVNKSENKENGKETKTNSHNTSISKTLHKEEKKETVSNGNVTSVNSKPPVNKKTAPSASSATNASTNTNGTSDSKKAKQPVESNNKESTKPTATANGTHEKKPPQPNHSNRTSMSSTNKKPAEIVNGTSSDISQKSTKTTNSASSQSKTNDQTSKPATSVSKLPPKQTAKVEKSPSAQSKDLSTKKTTNDSAKKSNDSAVKQKEPESRIITKRNSTASKPPATAVVTVTGATTVVASATAAVIAANTNTSTDQVTVELKKDETPQSVTTELVASFESAPVEVAPAEVVSTPIKDDCVSSNELLSNIENTEEPRLNHENYNNLNMDSLKQDEILLKNDKQNEIVELNNDSQNENMVQFDDVKQTNIVENESLIELEHQQEHTYNNNNNNNEHVIEPQEDLIPAACEPVEMTSDEMFNENTSQCDVAEENNSNMHEEFIEKREEEHRVEENGEIVEEQTEEVVEQLVERHEIIEESMTKNLSMPVQPVSQVSSSITSGEGPVDQSEDIMTRSFIEDPSNPKSNPFIEQEKNQEERIESNGHSNGYHQNGHYTNGHHHYENGNSNTSNGNGYHHHDNEDGSYFEKNDNDLYLMKQQQQLKNNIITDDDLLTNELQSLNINEKEIQNSQVASSISSNPNDPTTWNLLELPKPINPNDLPAPLLNTSLSAEKKIDKKTPNNHPVTSSPLSESTTTKLTNKKIINNNTVNNNQSSKPLAKIHPVYLEVSYIPAHGSGHYCDFDFFRRVRSRHYILSTQDASEDVLNALIKAKETWEEKNLQVSIIPTYESEQLRRWYVYNEEKLAKLKIDVYPAASLSTLTMEENPELSCQLYKLEF